MAKYVIKNTGFIPYLGINGPVNEGVEIEDLFALKMIKEGYILERVNPFDTSETVRVTVSNFDDVVFVTSRYQAYKRDIAAAEGKEYLEPTEVVPQTKENNKDNNNEKKDVHATPFTNKKK